MIKKDSSKKAFARLRQRAETILKETEGKGTDTTDHDLLDVLQELEVHQVELDLQNEALRRTARNLETARDEYSAFYEFAPVGFVTLDKTGTIEKANAAAADLLQRPGRFLVGQTFSSRVYPEDLPAYFAKIKKSSESGAKAARESLDLRLFGKDDRIRHFHLDLGAGLDNQGRFSCWQFAIVDITELKQTQETLQKSHDDLEWRVKERTAELSKTNEELRREIEKRKNFEADLKLKSKKIIKEQERRKHLSKKLVELLERERQDIAMSLHDELGQKLTKLNMELGFLAQNSSEQTPVTVKDIEKLQINVTETMDYVSGLAGSLKSHILENLGLVPAVKNMLNNISKKSNFKIHLDTKGIPLQVPQEKALTVYRIVQESVTNCIRYARANNIYIHLNGNEHFILSAIEDDGMGFDYQNMRTEKNGRERLGIMIMNERAVQAGGTFHIESRVGKGTVVTAEIPIQ
ncbi:MAG: PAS domain-containing protein [Desulfobacterales bacterium]|nr:PAS domain-containing protein [Desulfobacterales bacterium]